MAALAEPLTIGIEEEYLLVDAETRALASRPPEHFMVRCKDILGPSVSHEFLKSQVEIGTGVCARVTEARAELLALRRAVAEAAESCGMRLIAASTHPWSHWHDQEPVDLERYRILNAEHRSLTRRLSICGMHIHAGIRDENLRVDLMSQVAYFLPHLLALSTSSPFWEGRDTGLKAFRPTIMGDLPRSGLPETFESWNDWTELIADLANMGLVNDPSMIWWDLRPSAHHPTLELRICDVCTTLDDAIAIAALYQSLLGFLIELRRNNQRWRQYRRILVSENKWRAQRYGVDAELGDFGRGTTQPFAVLIEEMIALFGAHATALGCRAEVEHARTIVRRGTSADRQLAIFNAARREGASEREAQVAVVDWLVAETVAEPLRPEGGGEL